MTIKLKAPEHHSGFSHEGKSYEPDKQGVVEVPDELAPLALSHRLTPISDEEEESPAPRPKMKLAKSETA